MVDFPQPDGPTNATYSPCRMRNDTSSIAFGIRRRIPEGHVRELDVALQVALDRYRLQPARVARQARGLTRSTKGTTPSAVVSAIVKLLIAPSELSERGVEREEVGQSHPGLRLARQDRRSSTRRRRSRPKPAGGTCPLRHAARRPSAEPEGTRASASEKRRAQWASAWLSAFATRSLETPPIIWRANPSKEPCIRNTSR